MPMALSQSCVFAKSKDEGIFLLDISDCANAGLSPLFFVYGAYLNRK